MVNHPKMLRPVVCQVEFVGATCSLRAPDSDRSIVYDSPDGGAYLLIFSAENGSKPHDSRRGRLSEVVYRPGGKTEAIFLLPRKKRGKPLPAEYRALLAPR